MSRHTASLGRFADLRNGGNLPRSAAPHFGWSLLLAFFLVVAFVLLTTLDKAVANHAALTCGAC